MLYCKNCRRQVDESETEIGGKIDKVERWPDDGINSATGEKMLFMVRKHKICGGEVVDQDSIDGVKKVLRPKN